MANLIRDGKVFQIPSMMQTGKGVGMQTMDDALMCLLKDGKISAREAYLHAHSKTAFRPLLEKEQKGTGKPIMSSGYNL
jgi:twitching motility protein PilT